MDWMLLTAAVILVTLNIVASFSVVKNPLLAEQQKVIQLLLVWLLPAVGSIICLVMRSVDRPTVGTPFDRTAFVDSADAGGTKWDAPPGANLCGCDSTGGGADGGD